MVLVQSKQQAMVWNYEYCQVSNIRRTLAVKLLITQM